ncbi:MAG TPA: hypothetical protein VHM48_14740 [Candidatus Limnocylindrales bacterium]|nr:hypothetical protein [Candidatus Limnocylindrales bacterium]
MKKISRLPHEQAIADGDSGFGPEHDGLPVDQDVEGHQRQVADQFLPGMPGTGGDNLHRPISGGEIDGDDVEGHLMGHTKGERLSPGMPGTGGDNIAVEVDPEGVINR